MSRSSSIPAEAVAAVVRLSHEIRDLGESPAAWRHHFAGGVARLVDADFVVSGELGGIVGKRPHSLGAVVWGGAEHGHDMAGWQAALVALEADPEYSASMRGYLARSRGAECLVRTQLLADAEWYAATDYDTVYRTLGIDHHAWCLGAVPTAGEVSGGVFARDVGRRDFSEREQAVIALAHVIVTPLVGTALARFTDPSPDDLPPRPRQVLACLLQGDSDKQIAARLGLSLHTVNQYLKRIYRHFAVGTRAELLAVWVRRGRGRA